MDDLKRRQSMGFLAAEGLEIPKQLRGHAAPKLLRIILLELFSESIERHGDHDHFKIMWLVYFEEYGTDFPTYPSQLLNYLKNRVEKSSDPQILELVQGYCRQQICTKSDFETLQSILENEKVAYRLVGEVHDRDNPPTLMPLSTPEQGTNLVRDYELIGTNGGHASQHHLRLASKAISDGNYKSSIRESIHAVESAAKYISGNEKATLPDALSVLEKQRALHPALRKSLASLYGWTSDEKGIRHAEIDPTDEVPESMAIFMLSSCAAFAGWLLTAPIKAQV